MNEATGSQGKLEISSLFGNSLDVYRASFATFWLAVLALVGPGIALILTGGLIDGDFGVLLVILGVLWMIFGFLSLVGVVVKIVEDVESTGRVDARIGYFVGAVVPLLGRLVILSVATSAVVLVGYLFLIVPGIIALLKLSVAVPALFVERGHVFESMFRSASLTRGNLWRVFAVVLLIYIVLILIQVFLALVTGESEILAFLLSLAAAVAVYPYLAIISAVLFFRLRAIEEGQGFDRDHFESGVGPGASSRGPDPGHQGSPGPEGSSGDEPPGGFPAGPLPGR